jgi:tripartite-type tricarboxylate transporter receptor subunit TctC
MMTEFRRAVCATALIFLATGVSRADPVEDFYRGRTVNLYIGFTVGGGYDLYARMLARHLGRHIPGAPHVVPVNMPGTAGMTMASWLYSKAPQDGSALAIASQAIAIEQALGSSAAQYESRKFVWLGRAAPVVELSYTWFTSPTKTLDDARRRETVMGAINPNSNTMTLLKLLNAVAGTKFKIISGYPGTTEMHLAMERGETEGATKSWEAFKSDNGDWLRAKKVSILVQYAMKKADDLDAPLMMDLGRSDLDRDVLRFFASGNELGRAFMTGPDVPPARAAALRKAFSEAMRDPEFLEESKRRELEFGPLAGEEVQKMIDGTLQSSPEVVTAAKKTRDG